MSVDREVDPAEGAGAVLGQPVLIRQRIRATQIGQDKTGKLFGANLVFVEEEEEEEEEETSFRVNAQSRLFITVCIFFIVPRKLFVILSESGDLEPLGPPLGLGRRSE